jgi:hypothetical protein
VAVAGIMNPAAEKMNAIVAENRRGERIRIPDISSSMFDLPLYKYTIMQRARGGE